MASSKIKGITIEIGGNTTKLGKALEGVNKQSKDLQKLKVITDNKLEKLTDEMKNCNYFSKLFFYWLLLAFYKFCFFYAII